MRLKGMLEHRFHALGRACHLVVEDRGGRGQSWLDSAVTEIHRIQSRFGAYTPGSLVHQFNHPGERSAMAPLDPEATQLFDYVEALWERSGRLYDPTIGPLEKLWRTRFDNAPDNEAIRSSLAKLGWHHLQREDGYLVAGLRGLQINLNSCICPYAVDSVRRLLRARGVESALIDLDRDAGTIGRQPDGANWLVGVRYPHGSRTAIHRLKLNNGCYSLRGNFEQSLVLGGERFGRAYSPLDGSPIPGLLSVAVTAGNCLEACAAATVGRFRSEPEGLSWLTGLDLPWLAIDRQWQCLGPLARRGGLAASAP